MEACRVKQILCRIFALWVMLGSGACTEFSAAATRTLLRNSDRVNDTMAELGVRPQDVTLFYNPPTLLDMCETDALMPQTRASVIRTCALSKIVRTCLSEEGPLIGFSMCKGKTCEFAFDSTVAECLIGKTGIPLVEENGGNVTEMCGVPEEHWDLFKPANTTWLPGDDHVMPGQEDMCLQRPKEIMSLRNQFVCENDALEMRFELEVDADWAGEEYCCLFDIHCEHFDEFHPIIACYSHNNETQRTFGKPLPMPEEVVNRAVDLESNGGMRNRPGSILASIFLSFLVGAVHKLLLG